MRKGRVRIRIRLEIEADLERRITGFTLATRRGHETASNHKGSPPDKAPPGVTKSCRARGIPGEEVNEVFPEISKLQQSPADGSAGGEPGS